MHDTLKITGRRLREIQSGLAALKEKRLPNAESESLVASLWAMLRPAFEAREDTVRKLQARVTEMQRMEDGDEKDAEIAEIEAMSRGIDDYVHEVPKPKSVIGSANMPKPYKGEIGQMNTQGNAGIMIALAPELYQTESTQTNDEPHDE